MPEKTIQLQLNFGAGQYADEEKKEKATRQLREELMELNIESVDFVSAGKVPGKAKAVDLVIWGKLLMTLAASGGVLTTLIGAVQSWLTRNNQRSIILDVNGNKLEIKGISSDEQTRLANEWVRLNTKA